jgi:ParB-like chromosome segregation protein Spo0J
MKSEAIFKEKKIVYIKSTHLEVDPATRRRGYDPITLKKLREDIREFGFREEHPLVVRPNPEKKNHWLITCGQHRFEAGLKAGIGYFPCVKRRKQDDMYAIAEAYRDKNLHSPVDAITEAEYFHRLGMEILKERGHDVKSASALKRKYPEEIIALQMGVTKNYVMHRLPLLKLPKMIQYMIRRYYMPSQRGYKLSPSMGEELARLQNHLHMQNKADPSRKINVKDAVEEMAIRCYNDRLSRHELRKIVAQIAYDGYNEWEGKKPIEKDSPRCIICGEEAHENPWVPVCTKHKQELLAYASSYEPDLESFKSASVLNDSSLNSIYSKGKRVKSASVLNDDYPDAPLHERMPHIHRLKKKFRLKHKQEDINKKGSLK